MRYAARTKVPISKSRLEIEAIISRYKADQFGIALTTGKAMIQFRMKNWMLRFILPLPSTTEQDQRERWRALCLIIKAKFAAVDSKVTTLEEEFEAHIVMPDGKTMHEHLAPKLKQLQESGHMPESLLPDYTKEK
jgi:hypothetical protein